MTISYGHPEEVRAELPNAEVRLDSRYSRSYNSDSVHVSHHDTFQVSFASPITLEQISRSYIDPLRYFLALALGPVPRVVQTHLGLATPTAATPPAFHPLELRLPEEATPKLERLTNHHRMAFTIETRPFAEIVPRWFTVFQTFPTVCDLLFNAAQQSHLTAKFFNLASSLEPMHQKSFPQSSKKSPEHHKKVDKILKSAPLEHVEWLRASLAYSHTPKYRQRIRELLDFIGPVRHRFIDQDLEDWSRSVADYRNTVAHSKSLESMDWSHLSHTTRQVDILLRFTLMRHLGFTETECDGLYHPGIWEWH